MSGDQKNRDLRLKIANVRDYLEPGDVSKKKIDNSEFKTPVTRLVYSIQSFRNQHNFVAVRLEHKPERVAHRRFVIDDQNTNLFLW